MTIPLNTNFQPDDTIWYDGSTLANAKMRGTLLYGDPANNILELYNLTNTANIEYAITKPDAGQAIYFLNTATTLSYSSFSHILYLMPPDSFFEIETETQNNENVITQIENYCCIGTTPTTDFFGNPIDTTPPDKRCHGFVANDSIWQERDDGVRITAKVDREDCANGALYVSLSTGHFQSDRNIYKDNGSITANIFGVFANLSGLITYSDVVVDLLVEREQFDPIGPTIAIDKYFTESATGAYIIRVESTVTSNVAGRITPDLPRSSGGGFGGRKGR